MQRGSGHDGLERRMAKAGHSLLIPKEAADDTAAAGTVITYRFHNHTPQSKIFPGFKIPFGSQARFKAFISSSSTGSVYLANKAFRA